MATITWDRLLETFHRQNASVALLIPGSPPLFRINHDWQAGSMPPVSDQNISDMVAQVMPENPERREGYTYVDFWYSNVAFVQVMAFGYPAATLLVVSRMPPTRPSPARL